jgi:two-component system cell cycle sensor histidine kinase/response regulator CckA
MNLYSLTAKLFSMRKWPFYLVCIINLFSQLFTATMNVIISLIRWGYIDIERILIGCINSFAVTLLIAPVAIYLAQRFFNLEEMNRNLQKQIAERAVAEEALRKSEILYHALVETTNTGFVVVDTAGIVIDSNKEYIRLSGHQDIDDILGRSILEWTADYEKEKNSEAVKQCIKAGFIRNLEIDYADLNGNITPVEINATVVEKDSVPQILTLCRDISKRRQIEKEKEKLQTNLLRAQKMEAIGTLAGGIAHDFNNLLMVIQGHTSLIQDEIDPYAPFLEDLRKIEESVKKAADLTRQLLGFARGGKYEVMVTDLNELTDRSARLFGRTKKEITIHQKFQPDLWSAEVDRSQMEQVLLNLFVNAWQAMPSGGNIYLQTSNIILDEEYVKPHGMKSGKYVRISVTDSGTGMDELTKQKLFDPFFTTKSMGRGTGLGLASVYGIIQNHDGIITVYSEIGLGSVFNIYLPASGKVVSGRKEPAREVTMGEGTILLVDDEEMLLNVEKHLLEKLGYRVLTAGSGKDAIEIYKQNINKIRMVIMDMIMPQMSGGETFDNLKTINPHVKVLLSSGYSIDGQTQEILQRGFYGFIQKPFSLAELSKKLMEVLTKP